MADPALVDAPPAQRGGAKALLLTILGEFVLPSGGGAWTSTLVAACAELGIGEKNARQAIARTGDQGVIDSVRHGRNVRWELTATGRELLESGTRRIYGFGVAGQHWDGQWLVAHCPVPESQRAVRGQLRTRLGFLGFGELSPSLFVGPHVDRDDELRAVLDELGLLGESVVFRSATLTADGDVVVRAWDLGALAKSYRAFIETHEHERPNTPAESFRAVVELVHEWRRFPFIDPELPQDLLPSPWIGTEAVALFQERRRAWSPPARRWFESFA
ncbi:MAG: PaaX family transcriptional regulator [Ilumatobacter sp.]|nr:PaaX family transcriptional regulator [Ilumatobacter sp.]